MTPKDIADFERFLSSVGKADLFGYFDVSPDASEEAVADAIQTRRTWAQGQQGNPKYKTEAIWLIKNAARLRRVLLDDRPTYVAHLAEVSTQQQVEVLRMVVFGALAGGVLTEASEAAVRVEGQKLGLPPGVVDATLEQMLGEHGAQRESDGRDAAPFVDHYAILNLMPSAGRSEIDRAYRERYRQALQLPDKKRAAVLQNHLDQALKALSSPAERARYDEARAARLGASEGSSPPTTQAGTAERELEASQTPQRIQFRAGDKPAPDLSEPLVPSSSKDTRKALGFADAPRKAVVHDNVLSVDGPDVVALRARARPVEHTLLVRKTGPGPLAMRAVVDRDWLEVHPARLDPEAELQKVTVTVYPERMSRSRSVALVTFTTDDSQRRAITLEVKRVSLAPLVAAAGLAALALVAVGIASQMEADPVSPEAMSAILEVVVDPPAGEISINNDPVEQSQPGHALLSDGLEPGSSAFVRVALDGFRTWSESVVLPGPGERLTLSPALELSDRVNYAPSGGDVEGTLNSGEAQAALQRAEASLQACARAHGAPSDAPAAVEVTAFVDNKGIVIGAEAEPDGFSASPGLTRCVRRQLRALSMPFAKGDFATISRTVRVPGSR